MKRALTRVALALFFCVLGVVLALCLAGVLYRPELGIPPGFAGKLVALEGLSLRVLQEGTGQDLLFIHGSPGVLEDFAPQAKELAKTFRVTRYDRPGHGFSSDSGRYSLAYNAQVALALIEKLKLERVIVVGHSYGGSTALALALLRSPRVAGYVVLDSAVYKNVRAINPAYKYLRLGPFGLGLARAIPSRVTETKITEALSAEFVASAPPDGFIALRSRVWRAPKVTHATANEHTLSNAELAQQSAHYREIAAPLYIAAQQDNAARRAAAQRLQRAVKGATLALLPRTGHYIQFEQAAAVTELIRRAASEH